MKWLEPMRAFEAGLDKDPHARAHPIGHHAKYANRHTLRSASGGQIKPMFQKDERSPANPQVKKPSSRNSWMARRSACPWNKKFRPPGTSSGRSAKTAKSDTALTAGSIHAPIERGRPRSLRSARHGQSGSNSRNVERAWRIRQRDVFVRSRPDCRENRTFVHRRERIGDIGSKSAAFRRSADEFSSLPIDSAGQA